MPQRVQQLQTLVLNFTMSLDMQMLGEKRCHSNTQTWKRMGFWWWGREKLGVPVAQ
jgi:hypothetical protein